LQVVTTILTILLTVAQYLHWSFSFYTNYANAVRRWRHAVLHKYGHPCSVVLGCYLLTQGCNMVSFSTIKSINGHMVCSHVTSLTLELRMDPTRPMATTAPYLRDRAHDNCDTKNRTITALFKSFYMIWNVNSLSSLILSCGSYFVFTDGVLFYFCYYFLLSYSVVFHPGLAFLLLVSLGSNLIC